MKRFYIFISLVFLQLVSPAQVQYLKPEFRNLSWIMDYKAAEVVSTLSEHYKTDSLLSDSDFVNTTYYNLYYDSLSLWYITKNVLKDNDTSAKATVTNATYVDDKYTTEEWLKIYDEDTRAAYKKENNSTKSAFCIPSTYSNLSLFYKEESKYITSRNEGRIKIYQITSDFPGGVVKHYLVFHKTIKPINSAGVSVLGWWMPYCYLYAKPKHKVYSAPINKLWESKTGLPYSEAQQLGLTDDRIPKILSLIGKPNDEILIKEDSVHVDRKYNIAVSCDTCQVKLYDNAQEDDDTIDFVYSDDTTRIPIKKAGVFYKIIMAKSNIFYIFAVSEGSLETCTVDAVIDGVNHIFALKKGELISIQLNKI